MHQLAGVDVQNVTYELETQTFLDLPSFINNSQVMLNVSKVQETGPKASYDVIIRHSCTPWNLLNSDS